MASEDGVDGTTWVREDIAAAAAEEREREYQWRREVQRMHYESLRSRLLSVLTFAGVILVLLSGLALIGYVVHTISSEHQQRITVRCEDDPSNDLWEREYNGLPADVKNACSRG